MGDYDTAADPELLELEPAPAQDPPAGSCVLLNAPLGDQWLGHEQRRLERFPVQASRPIALRLLDEHLEIQGNWVLADILDISLGGLCLMLSGSLKLQAGQTVQLDLHAHPDFGDVRLNGQVRWCRSAAGFTTVGVAFPTPLTRLPRLELERRSKQRDPNEESWAQS